MNTQTNVCRLEIHFPDGINDWHGVTQQALANKYQRVFELACEAMEVEVEGAEGKPRLLATVLDELFSNVVFHDMLGLSGEEREVLMDSRTVSPELQRRVVECISGARGMVGEMVLTRCPEVVMIEVKLNRDFSSFNERWKTVTSEDYIPDFDKPSNRGMLIISGLCETGEYFPETRTLRFTFRRKK